jgi:signal transduction histidine kinase
VDTFLPVRTVELLLAAGALLGACAALAALRRGISPASRPLGIARALLASLGDAVLLVDHRGRIVEANDAAARLAGVPAAELVGKELSSLGPDLPVLARGLARGPASGIVSVAVAGRTIRARAALAAVSDRPGGSLVALRPEPPPQRPPPLPSGRQVRPPAASVNPADAREALAAIAAATREPLARAGHAASLLRLTAPSLGTRAAASLDALEEAIEDADRRVAALVAAGQVGVRRAVDLAALVEDVAGTVPVPAGVRIRTDLRLARALADDRALRTALREVLRAAAASLGAGAELAVAVRGDGIAPVIEIAASGAGAASAAAFARALLAPHGGRVEEEQAGSGRRLRVVLPVAPVEALAPA